MYVINLKYFSDLNWINIYFFFFDIRQIKAQDQEIEEITPIEKQIFDSIEALEKLTVEGHEVVRAI